MTDQHNNNAIDYIEFNVNDIAKAKAFYGAAFGWTFTDFGPAYCEFNDGQRKGGFAAIEGDIVTAGPLVVLYASDLEMSLQNVTNAGGKITKPIFEFPGGRRFQFTDPQGYELAVWN